MVASDGQFIEPDVKNDDHRAAVRSSDPDGEDVDEDWPEDLPEDLPEDSLDSAGEIEAKIEDRGSRIENRESVERRDPRSQIPNPRSLIRNPQSGIRCESRLSGLKKPNKKQIALNWPPTPRGCEWRRSDDGLNLWRCWTEWDDGKAKRIKKSRYAGHLSDDAWRIMKEYDHEAFISIVGERLRRHGGR
jgi:hypothetical protein